MGICLKQIGAGVTTLALAAALLTGCDESDSDNGGGNSLAGIWRHTQIQAGDTLYQETTQISANGVWTTIWADFEDELCDNFQGTWSADEDSLTTTSDDGTRRSVYNLSGDVLSVTDPSDGQVRVYARRSTMASCDDYDFSSPDVWSGTISAQLDGAAVSFGNDIYGGVDPGLLTFGGNAGLRQLQITALAGQPGTYALGSGTMAVYVPDIHHPTDMFTTVATIAEGTLILTAVSANHVQGTFSFNAINLATQQTMSVTDGVVDITHP